MNLIPQWNRDDHPIHRLKNELDNAFQRFFDDPNVSSNSFWNRNSRFVPVLDVEEKSDRYTVEAELPGVKKEDIDLNLNDDGRLSIAVNRKEEVEEKDENNTYIHRERRYDAMQRSLYLANAKPDGVSAKLEDGLLKVTVTKEEQLENARRIEIE